ncbi:MarR family winged helix-turn-helix transcriptional regulator [Humibacter antri]
MQMNDPSLGRAPSDDEISAFQVATRDLIDVAVRSVEVVAPGVSLPQFRLMLVLDDLGITPSTKLARELAVSPSSVTRMADRLVASGHVTRERDPEKRSIVALALSPLGIETVHEVLSWRHVELARILHAVDPADRAVTARALSAFHRAAAGRPEHSHLGWLPL